MKRYLQISPFYGGSGWYDKTSGIFFDPSVKEFEVDDEVTQMGKIYQYIRKNLLIDVTHLHNALDEEAKANKIILEKSKKDGFSANMLLRDTRLKEGELSNDNREVQNKEEEKEEISEKVETKEEAEVVEEVVEEKVTKNENVKTNNSKKKNSKRKK